MKFFLVMGSVLLLCACSAEPGSAKWCKIKQEQSKSEWTMSDATTYATSCIIDGTAVGSQHWCERLSDKPKGEWTADDTASYARHCVI